VVALYSRVFIIIDALDEFQTYGGHRERLLDEVLALQARCGIKVLVTSRFIPEIMKMFNGTISLKFYASPKDIWRYTDGHMLYLPPFVKRSPDLQEEIRAEIIKAVDGMHVSLSLSAS
jgi:hypothetical protein